MVLAGKHTYLQHPGRSGASLGNVPIPAFGQTGGLHCLPPVVLWLNALRIPCGAFCQRASPPQGCKRSHISPVYATSETSHTYLETYPNADCDCRGIDVGWHLLPG